MSFTIGWPWWLSFRCLLWRGWFCWICLSSLQCQKFLAVSLCHHSSNAGVMATEVRLLINWWTFMVHLLFYGLGSRESAWMEPNDNPWATWRARWDFSKRNGFKTSNAFFGICEGLSSWDSLSWRSLLTKKPTERYSWKLRENAYFGLQY